MNGSYVYAGPENWKANILEISLLNVRSWDSAVGSRMDQRGTVVQWQELLLFSKMSRLSLKSTQTLLNGAKVAGA